VLQQNAKALALKGVGLDDGRGFVQAGVRPGELGHVDHRPWPETVELLQELALQATEES
jgi:hypothetical protein